ncbi:fibronectin type III domain-containing protein [Emticicia sp. BO119]|uniref:fibronectin type III domain-containing protein n=1 Tax=Emticicia sp. BO119 TaxID=2757768 RepID=UPI0015F11C2D|nr:fibronectin type III domain-containing protein [Emticicia sp. BO119]MBA4853573.1 fibronectin type III domain-containing protein [Emticicia sp. BO119]
MPIVFFWQCAYSQISYQNFPLSNQVLQRNEQNEAIVNVKGLITERNHSSITLRIFRDENTFYENTINISGISPFEFSPRIPAGKYNYSVRLYLDGKEVKSAIRVAAGDVFLIYGQSNALGYGGINEYQPARDPFLRYYVMYDFNNGTGEWLVPFESAQWPGTGLIALELERILSQQYNYPIGVVVAAVGGAPMKGLNDRNAQNPADPNNNYGKMIIQTKASGLKDQIRYLVFRHGESDGYYFGDSDAYPEQFKILYDYLNTDFPNLRKIYNLQANILTQANSSAGFLRDFQRRSKYLYPKISTLSTVGTIGYDGLHYNFNGYQQTAFELSRVIGREIYGNYESIEVYSPDIQRIFWEGNRLVLEFDAGMQMIYPQDSITNSAIRSMKDFIYVDGKNNVVQSGEAIGNKIYLTIANTSNPEFVSYLPDWFADNTFPFYNGVHIKNSRGMRAFSFDHVRIGGQAPETPTTPVPPANPEPPVEPPVTNNPESPGAPTTLDLTVSPHEEIMVKLTWNGNAQTKYHIQRSVSNSNNLTEIGTINGDIYYDTQVELNNRYYYRVVAETANGEQSNIKDVLLKCLDSILLKNITQLAYIGANTSITALISLNSTKQLTLEANKFIDLNPGFDAPQGSFFTARIGGCKND